MKNRYQIDATISSGIGLNVSAEMSRVRVYRSKLNGTAVTSEVVFSIEMTSLPVGGMITRIDCGRMMRRMVCDQLMPSAVAASSWPLSTDEQAGAHDFGHVGGLVERQADDGERRRCDQRRLGLERDPRIHERDADVDALCR